jgi:hypothetical protein
MLLVTIWSSTTKRLIGSWWRRAPDRTRERLMDSLHFTCQDAPSNSSWKPSENAFIYTVPYSFQIVLRVVFSGSYFFFPILEFVLYLTLDRGFYSWHGHALLLSISPTLVAWCTAGTLEKQYIKNVEQWTMREHFRSIGRFPFCCGLQLRAFGTSRRGCPSDLEASSACKTAGIHAWAANVPVNDVIQELGLMLCLQWVRAVIPWMACTRGK